MVDANNHSTRSLTSRPKRVLAAALALLFLLIVGMNIYGTLLAERQLFPDVAALPSAATVVFVAFFLLVHLGICAVVAAAILVTLRTFAGIPASTADVLTVIGYAHAPLAIWALFARVKVLELQRLVHVASTDGVAPELLIGVLQSAHAARPAAYVGAVFVMMIVLRTQYRLGLVDAIVAGFAVPIGIGTLVWATGLL